MKNFGEGGTEMVSSVVSGFDRAGNKVREFIDAEGQLTRRTVETKGAVQQLVDAYVKWYGSMGKMRDLENAGKTDSTQYIKAKVDAEEANRAILQLIGTGKNYNQVLKQTALQTGEVTKAIKEYNLIKENNQNKAAEAARRAQEEQQNREMEAAWKQYEAEERAAQQAAEAAVERGLKAEQAAAQRAEKEAEMSAKETAAMEAEAAKQEQILDQQVAKYAESEEKKRQAAINAEFSREEARKREEQAEQERTAREVATMDESLAKQEQALDRQVAKYVEAEEKKRQASIRSEFEREEARKKAEQAAEEQIAKELQMMDQALAEKQVNQAQQAYANLTEAVKNYNIAKQAGDRDGMAFAQARINAIMGEVSGIQEAVNASNMEAETKERILGIIQQCRSAEEQHASAIKGTVTQSGELNNQITSLLTRYLSLMSAIRMISSLIKNTVEYVSEYSDKMNEIQMITLKSNSEIDQLASTYRQIAADMSVSSLDMADAAIYFTRQGLGAAEIEKRLRNTTMYAKAANIEFETAAELITSVVNSMNLVEDEAEDGRNAAQRVADVFLAVGDNAATSGEEIGTAMQKAGAAAGAFGMEFEWLAAYIATVSETTRQEASSIGTAFNTLIARLHSIRSTGYNSEDETKINDIQKALANINVTLLDQSGNWRDMTDIFNDIAGQWDTLDGKTKSYIATTMAGVKQQNVFLALMEDLSKHAEGQSRAWELYGIAMESAGTAQEKYAVYTDSVAAAQERLTVAQERFYSLLDDSVIKAWYDGLANIVNVLADGNEMFGSLATIIPVVIGVMGSFVTYIALVNSGLGKTLTLTTLLESHPLMIAISAGLALTVAFATAIGTVASNIETMEERFQAASDRLSDANNRMNGYLGLQKNVSAMQKDLGDKTQMTNEDLQTYSGLLSSLSGVSAVARKAVDNLKTGFGNQKDQIATVNAELDKYIEKTRKIAASAVIDQLNNTAADPNQDLLYRILNWHNGEGMPADGSSRLAAILAEVLKNENTSARKEESLPKDVYQRAEQLAKDHFSEYGNFADAVSYAAEIVWSEYFGQAETMADYYDSMADEKITQIISDLGASLTSVERNALRSMLMDYVTGEDGIISQEEYAEINKSLVSGIFDFMEHGIDAGAIQSASAEEFKRIGKSIFGDGFAELFPDADEVLADNPNLADGFINAYAEMIEAGFSDADIAERLKNIDLADWDKVAEQTKTDLKAALKKIFNTNYLGQLEDEITSDGGSVSFLNPLMWDKLDLSTLQLITDLANAGVGFEQINQLMAESAGTIDFGNKLLLLANDMGVLSARAEETTEATEDQSETVTKIKEDIDNLNDAINTLAGGGQISFKDLLDLTTAHPELLAVIGDATALQEKLAELKASGYEDLRENVKSMLRDTDLSKTSLAGYATDDITTVGELLDSGAEGFDEAAQWLEDATNGLVDAADHVEEASESWLQAQANIAKANADANWAKSNEYAFQINELMVPETADFGGQTVELWDTTQDRLNAVMETWNAYDDTIKEGIRETYPGLIGALAEVEAALADVQDETKDSAESQARLEKANENLNNVLNKTKKYLETKYFKNTAKAIKDLEEGTIKAATAYETFYGECDKLTKAYDEIDKAQTKIDAGTQLVESDVNSLADALGVSADTIINDWPGALEMFEQMRQAGEEAYNALNKEATMRILGVSEADFSNIQNGMTAVQDTASSTIQMLLALGQFKLEEREVEEGVTFPMLSGDGKTITNVTAEAKGKYQFLVPTSANPLKSRGGGGGGSKTTDDSGGGGGGGGGSSSNSNSMTEVERVLDVMSKTKDIQDARRSFYQAQSGYYEQTGQLQGVIAYAEKEREVLESQNKTLEDNIAKIEEYIAAKKAELATMTTADEGYEEVADDLDKLQQAHQEYTQQVIDNKTAIDELNESIEEQHKAIRQMQIDIRKLVYDAIVDREEKAKNMLENEIDMENEILDIITKRYEKERDEILKTNEAKIDALNEEKDLLDKQLELRRQLSEEQDKEAELAELEAQYQRIIADPTRAKEALEIRKKIEDLRKEMSWDKAEKEVEAQKESIDQQITSLEDYAEYVTQYYEDLFEHPQKLIEEMREILKKSDEEIIEWLQANNEEYAKSTANRQKQMTDDWQTTLDEMRGKITTYWEEVEEIIAQGDEAIIEFLKENSADYAEAGKLEAEAYVDEWKEQLDDLKKALEEVQTVAAPDYDVIEEAENDGSGSGSGGGGGGGGSGGNGGNSQTRYGYTFTDKNTNRQYRSQQVYLDESSALTYGTTQRNAVIAGYRDKGEYNKLANIGPVTTFLKGGLSYKTGLQWLDGTEQDPERVLSPYQTKLFESMVQALEGIDRISIPTMPNFSGMQMTGGGENITVGDIIVQVDNLDTDDDYETLAQKVSEVLMERIGRTLPVGGIRLTAF